MSPEEYERARLYMADRNLLSFGFSYTIAHGSCDGLIFFAVSNGDRSFWVCPDLPGQEFRQVFLPLDSPTADGEIC